MKKMLCLLLFVMSFVSFSQDSEELPRELWEEIIEIKLSNDEGIIKWKDEIKIGLHGNFTEKDSTQIISFINKLDSITETISIRLSDYGTSNLKIYLSDLHISKNVTFKYEFKGDIGNQHIKRANIFYEKTKKEDEISKKNLDIALAKILFTGTYTSSKNKESGFNIFNQHIDKEELYLSKNDLKIVSEIYKEGFEERIIEAEKLYKESVLNKVDDFKIRNRNSNLWWVKNPYALMFFPVFVLILFFSWLVSKIKKILINKISDNLIRFSVFSFIVLLFVGIIIVLGFSIYDSLMIPNDSRLWIVRSSNIYVTIVSIIIFFPFLFLFRFIEMKIQKSSQNIYSKTGLIFLSTGFLPLCIYLIILYLHVIEVSPEFYQYNELCLMASYIFLFLMSIASLRAIISYFMFKERELIIENKIQLSHLRELKTQAELKSLQSQINPHFLYNSLNSIASLAPVDAFKTQKMAYSLSDLFKYSINRKGKKMSTIQDEINMVNSYLEIEKIRFGERLQFHIEVEKSLLNYEIPLFLIQPLVENAIKHGISKNKDKGIITLKIEEKETQLNILVYDNGPDFPEGLVSGHGLQTVFDLLNLSYQDQASLNWTNEPEKMIEIKLPKNK